MTARRKVFAAHYIAYRDPVKSALDAGYSESAAETQEPRLLEDADVRALLSEVERHEKADDDVTRLLQAMLPVRPHRGGPPIPPMSHGFGDDRFIETKGICHDSGTGPKRLAPTRPATERNAAKGPGRPVHDPL